MNKRILVHDWYCKMCDNAGVDPWHKMPKWLHNLIGRYAIFRPIFNALIKGEQK